MGMGWMESKEMDGGDEGALYLFMGWVLTA